MKKLTEKQELAASSKGSVVVYAAAGSGKTAVLTERVIRIISDAEHPVPADRLLIVTFTNAAAAEMKGRIAEALAELSEREPSNYLEKQQLLLSAAPICTIDSFCINLVRDNFEKAGVRPDFSSADEARLAPVRDAVIREMVNERAAAEDEDFALLAECLNLDASLADFSETVNKVYSSSRSLPFPEEWLRESAECYLTEDHGLHFWQKKLFSAAEKELDAILSLVDTGDMYFREFPDAHAACGKYFAAFAADAAMVKSSIEEGNWNLTREGLKSLSLAAAGRSLGKVGGLFLKKYNSVVREPVNKRVKKLSTAFAQTAAEAEALLTLEARAVGALVSFVLEYGQRLRAELIKKNILTFDMTEHMAFELVCRQDESGRQVPTEIGKRLSEYYYGVLVDEYQDNNALQDALFRMISDEGRQLFTVGDAKQSIYGFRHADPSIFVGYRDEYPEYKAGSDRGKIVLDANFRSRSGICAFTDFLFSKIMKKEVAGMEYTADDKMTARLAFAETEEPSVEYHSVLFDGELTSADEAEARHIAAYIKQAVEKGTPIGAVNGAEPRRAEYRDFAVLMRSVKGGRGSALIKELRRVGIPVSFESDQLFGTTEINAILSLLKAIESRSDAIALTAAATGPIFAIPIDTVASAKVEYPSSSLYGSFLLAAEAGCRELKQLTDELKELAERSIGMRVSQLIEYLYERYSLREIMSSADEGCRRKADLDAFMNFAREYESSGEPTLSGFLRFTEGSSCVSSLSGAGGSNAVSLMTIHKSKGLQFPICILAGCSAHFDHRDERAVVRMRAHEGISVNISDRITRTRQVPISARALSDSINREMLAEEERLLYVALTRAAEKAVFVMSDKSEFELPELSVEEKRDLRLGTGTVRSADCYAAWLKAAAALLVSTEKSTACEYLSEVGSDTPLLKICRFSDGADTAAERWEELAVPEPDVEKAGRLAEVFSFTYPHGAPALSKTTVSRILAEENRAQCLTRRPSVCSSDGRTAAEKGTAMHRFMQYADFASAERDIESEITRLTEWEYLSESETELLDRAALRSFFESELYKKISSAAFVLREQNFLVPLEGGETLIQGSVDCAFGDDSGLTVIDFKTTAADEEGLKQLYQPQLDIYAAAMSELTELLVTGKYIYSFHLGKTVELN